MREAAEVIVKALVSKRHHVNAIGALGFSSEVMRVLQHKGGTFDLYLWTAPRRMVKSWMLDEDKELLDRCMRGASNVIMPESKGSRKAMIASRNRMFAAASDTVLVYSPCDLDGDCADIVKIAKNLVVFKGLDDVKKFDFSTV
jgi:hypothetical protein